MLNFFYYFQVYDLYNASKDGELERVKLSLKNGADVNFRDKVSFK